MPCAASSPTTREPTTKAWTFLVREEGTDRLVLVVGDDDDPTPVTQAVMDDWEYLFE